MAFTSPTDVSGTTGKIGVPAGIGSDAVTGDGNGVPDTGFCEAIAVGGWAPAVVLEVEELRIHTARKTNVRAVSEFTSTVTACTSTGSMSLVQPGVAPCAKLLKSAYWKTEYVLFWQSISSVDSLAMMFGTEAIVFAAA